MARDQQYTAFDKLMEALGISRARFECELRRFELSPPEWLDRRLRALGWVRKEEVPEPPPCDRPCCK